MKTEFEKLMERVANMIQLIANGTLKPHEVTLKMELQSPQGQALLFKEDSGEEVMIDIIGPDGKVHYRRPYGHPVVLEAIMREGYNVRISEPEPSDEGTIIEPVVLTVKISHQNIEKNHAVIVRILVNLSRRLKMRRRNHPFALHVVREPNYKVSDSIVVDVIVLP